MILPAIKLIHEIKKKLIKTTKAIREILVIDEVVVKCGVKIVFP
jgi:hypothetical protein